MERDLTIPIFPLPPMLKKHDEAIRGQKEQDLDPFRATYLGPPFNDFPVVKSIKQKFPDRKITRVHIVEELQTGDPYEAVILMMIWGLINATRPQSKGDKLTTPFYKLLNTDQDDIRKFAKSAEKMILEGKLSELFKKFDTNDDFKIPGVGPAYFTKLFFFIGQKCEDVKLKPLILDKWTCTAFCALLLSSGHKEHADYYFRAYNEKEGAQPRLGQRHIELYEAYVGNMNRWAAELQVPPDMLEQYVFGYSLNKKCSTPNMRLKFLEVFAKTAD